MGVNKILLGQQLTFGVTGCAFQAEQSLSVPAATPYVLPAGFWIVEGQANLQVQYSPDSGSTWRILTPTTVGGFFFSDGFNVRLFSTTGTLTVHAALLA